jgi:hypothetical protein
MEHAWDGLLHHYGRTLRRRAVRTSDVIDDGSHTRRQFRDQFANGLRGTEPKNRDAQVALDAAAPSCACAVVVHQPPSARALCTRTSGDAKSTANSGATSAVGAAGVVAPCSSSSPDRPHLRQWRLQERPHVRRNDAANLHKQQYRDGRGCTWVFGWLRACVW